MKKPADLWTLSLESTSGISAARQVALNNLYDMENQLMRFSKYSIFCGCSLNLVE